MVGNIIERRQLLDDLKKAEGKSNSIKLFRLIFESLPDDINASVVKRSVDLAKLSKEAGLSDGEFSHFFKMHQFLFVRIQQASKFNGSAKFQIASGFESEVDVAEYIKSSIQRGVTRAVRKKESVYRGPH